MQFQCENTDGPAQIGKISLNNDVIIAPNILFPSSSHYDFPIFDANFIRLGSDNENTTNSSFLTVGAVSYTHLTLPTN